MKKVLVICGSTRKQSSNLNLIKAIQDMSSELEVSVFTGLADLPQFNPDNDIDPAPPTVASFRNLIRNADGVLICTPEYAMGVPGSLKNAIDWVVSSCEFSHKPTALITASTSGKKAHLSLMETLHVIEAKLTDETQLVISFIKTKVNDKCEITNPETLTEVKGLLSAFIEIMKEPVAM